MIVKAKTNRAADLPKELQKYAFNQDQEGVVDITPGLHYLVYATSRNELGDWFFVHTDEISATDFMWMPAALYEVVEDSKPKGWITQSDEGGTQNAYPSLFESGVEEGIVDGEDRAVARYLEDVDSDPTFPSGSQLDELNKAYFQQRQQEKEAQKLKLARERGYEYPQEPTENN